MPSHEHPAAQGHELIGTDGRGTCTCPDFKGPVDTRHVCDVHGPLYSDDAELSGTDRSAASTNKEEPCRSANTAGDAVVAPAAPTSRRSAATRLLWISFAVALVVSFVVLVKFGLDLRAES